MIKLMINRKRLKGYSIAKEDMKCFWYEKIIPKGSFFRKISESNHPIHSSFLDCYCILWPGLNQETFKIG